MSPEEQRRACDWPNGEFTFHDSPGEHDPCYVVMPGGAMIPLNHHAAPGVDIARAKFIIAACNAALAHAPESEWRPTHRHIKRGSTYRVLGEAEVQISKGEPVYGTTERPLREGDLLTVYQAKDGKLWARFPDEFNDGRFEPARTALESQPAGEKKPYEIVGHAPDGVRILRQVHAGEHDEP